MYINVPYSEKNDAKALGAKYDFIKKQWFVPESLDIKLFDKWIKPREYINIIGDEEQRDYGGSELYIDLVPNSCWFKNVRKNVSVAEWENIRHFVYLRADNKCEICGSNSPLEAHERWHYDNETKIQKLVRLIALCKQCHGVTHFGYSELKGKREEMYNHLCKIRGFTNDEADRHILDAYKLWGDRNKFKWTLDISLIRRIT